MTYKVSKTRDREPPFRGALLELTSCAVLGTPLEYFAHEQRRVAARVNISE